MSKKRIEKNVGRETKGRKEKTHQEKNRDPSYMITEWAYLFDGSANSNDSVVKVWFAVESLDDVIVISGLFNLFLRVHDGQGQSC